MSEYTWSDPPSQTAFPIDKVGFRFIFAAAFVTLILALIDLEFLAFLGLAATIFITAFFRDPDRRIPAKAGAVVSPADGKVVVVQKLDQSPLYGGPCWQISIFMSVFNVHVNRVPFEGTVGKMVYHPGRYLNATLDKASEHNERQAVELRLKDGRHLWFVQIAGLVARRIITRIQEGETVKRGQRFGIICFGSRLDVYLPPDASPQVVLGEKVKAGASVIASLEPSTGHEAAAS